MKFRRKPVERTVVDALKGETEYTVQMPSGAITQVPIDAFEADFDPVKRSPPEKKARKPRKAKEGAGT